MAGIKKVTVTARMGGTFKIESQIREHKVTIDQPAPGGSNTGPTPLEYLLFALAGCIGSIARIMASQRKINLRGMEITVEGELDVDGLLGKNPGVRSGFQWLKVRARLDADLSTEEKRKFLHEVDERCPVSDNLLRGAALSVELEE